MTKWICINAGLYNLTVNKVYDGYDDDNYLGDYLVDDDLLGEYAGVRLINDLGCEYTYNKSMFIRLDEWREQQIKTVLDD